MKEVIQDEKQKAKLVCGTCNKPLRGSRKGSMTSWIFSDASCNCADSKSADLPALSKEPSAKSESTPEPAPPGDVGLKESYEVTSTLGEGGMATVYKVRDKSLQKDFAVKVLRPEFSGKPEIVKRFEQEATACGALTHPNLVAVYDHAKTKNGLPYLVMDYVDGQDLGKIIKDEVYLDPDRAVDIFVQCAEALEHAHSKGIIHRDLKPSNVIIAKSEKGGDFAKVVDFGIAKVAPKNESDLNTLTQTGEVFGSPLYMSPEQCLGNELDARSDVYSFGCLMYEALSGKLPFSGQNPVKTIISHLNEQPKDLAQRFPSLRIAAGLDRLVMKCLEKEPGERYQNMTQLRSDLEQVRDGKEPAFATPKKVQKKGKRSNIPWEFRTLRLAVIVFGVMAVLIMLTAQPKHEDPIANPVGQAQELDDLALKYFNAGQYDRAIPLLEFGLTTYKSRGGTDNGWAADNMEHIGRCYAKLGNLAEAEKWYKKALEIYDKGGYGNKPPSVRPQAVRDYADLLRKLNRVDQAKTLEATLSK
jgi:serine/threonine protein kinase